MAPYRNKFTSYVTPPTFDAVTLESLGSLRDELEYYIRAHQIIPTNEQLDMYEKSLKNWCLAGKNYWTWIYELIDSIREENQRIRSIKVQQVAKEKREAKAKEIVEKVFVPRLRKEKVKKVREPKEPKIRQPRAPKPPRIKKEYVRDFEREYAFKLSNKKNISIEEAYLHIYTKKEEKEFLKKQKRLERYQAKQKKKIEVTEGTVILEFENQKAAVEWYAKQHTLPIASAKTAVHRSIKNKTLTTKGLLFKKKNE